MRNFRIIGILIIAVSVIVYFVAGDERVIKSKFSGFGGGEFKGSGGSGSW